MQKKKTVVRLTINAMLIAIYIVLSLPIMTLNVGGLKFTFEHFPVVLCAVLFGPIDGIIVGTLGELVNQMTTFGITPTTALWILPIAFRGFFMGMGSVILKKHMQPSAIVQKKVPIMFFILCVVSGICSSCLNTLALYVDSKMFGYYSVALVWGAFSMRIIIGAITSILMVFIIKPILHALKRAHLL